MRAEGGETEEQQDEGLGFWQKRAHGRAGVFERDDKSTPLGWRKEISLPFPGGRRWLFRGPQECKEVRFHSSEYYSIANSDHHNGKELDLGRQTVKVGNFIYFL